MLRPFLLRTRNEGLIARLSVERGAWTVDRGPSATTNDSLSLEALACAHVIPRDRLEDEASEVAEPSRLVVEARLPQLADDPCELADRNVRAEVLLLALSDMQPESSACAIAFDARAEDGSTYPCTNPVLEASAS